MGEEKATREKDLWKKIREIQDSAHSCPGSSPHGENPERVCGGAGAA